MPNASVLPVPVRAWPMRSVPRRATESVISWMGKAVVMPTRSSASAISGMTPSSLKVVVVSVLSNSLSSARMQGRIRMRPT